MKRVTVVLGRAKMSVPHKIENDRFIVASMLSNPGFDAPSPPLDSIITAVNELETAYLAAQRGRADDTAWMRAKENVLDLLMKSLGYYVEGVANDNLATAKATVLSAGMGIKGSSARVAQSFGAKNGEHPGEVKLNAPYVKHATYIWSMSTDGIEWNVIGISTQSRFTKNGLTSGQRYYFRMALLESKGQGPWSNTVNLIVE